MQHTDTPPGAIATGIRRVLGDHGYGTLRQIDRATGIPAYTLQRRFHDGSPFRVDELERIAAACGFVSVSEFLLAVEDPAA